MNSWKRKPVIQIIQYPAKTAVMGNISLNMSILFIRIPGFMRSEDFTLKVEQGRKNCYDRKNGKWQNDSCPADPAVL